MFIWYLFLANCSSQPPVNFSGNLFHQFTMAYKGAECIMVSVGSEVSITEEFYGHTFSAFTSVLVGPVCALGAILAWCAGALICIHLALVPTES